MSEFGEFDADPSSLAELFSRLGRELTRPHSSDEVLTIISRRAHDVIPGAEHAAITRGRHGTFETIAATSGVPPQVDELQYALGSGPCVDAILTDTVYRVGDLATTERWPEFGQQAVDEFGIRSMLSVRMYLEDDDLLAGLNLYSSAVDAFDAFDETTATLLATHGALALTVAELYYKVDNLNRALETSRQIGATIGILMATQKVSYQKGFDLLRIASQTRHRKLASIAEEVLLTGSLDLPNTPAPRERYRHSPER
jgi:GAF domain-containing protein